MGSCCEWPHQIRHRNVRRNSHLERSTVHKHRETCGEGYVKTETCCDFVYQICTFSMKRDGLIHNHSVTVVFAVSKFSTRTLRHDTSISRESDGAVKVDDLIKKLKVKFVGTLQ